MNFTLHCDSCEFGESVEGETTAYVHARDHEGEHPRHTVVIAEEQ